MSTPLQPPVGGMATRIQLEARGDDKLYAVRLDGKHIGSVRLTYRGWCPLGVFLFRGAFDPVYYSSKEVAAYALGREYIRRQAERYAGAPKSGRSR